MEERDPNIEEAIKDALASIFAIATTFILLVVFVVLLITLSSCATPKRKCPAYGTSVEKTNYNV